MSSNSTTPATPLALPPSPSKHENLVGAILWLLPSNQVPDHGRYKLKAKACNHPCVVVQDCRTIEPDFVRICILASYSHSNPYSSLDIGEQYAHVPIHPNAPDSRVQPSILYLRNRQKTEMLLKKTSWVKTKQIYKVPVSILRPYETFQSWCRYRLNDTSIQALQSVLLIKSLDSGLVLNPSQSLSSPGPSPSESLPDAPISSADIFWSPIETASQTSVPQQTPTTPSDIFALDESTTAYDEPQIQPLIPANGDTDNPFSEDTGLKTSVKPCVTLSYGPCPFHITFPFDAGPNSKTTLGSSELTPNSSLLPPPVTTDNTRSKRQSRRQGTSIVRICGAFVFISLMVVLVLAPIKATDFISAVYLRL